MALNIIYMLSNPNNVFKLSFLPLELSSMRTWGLFCLLPYLHCLEQCLHIVVERLHE